MPRPPRQKCDVRWHPVKPRGQHVALGRADTGLRAAKRRHGHETVPFHLSGTALLFGTPLTPHGDRRDDDVPVSAKAHARSRPTIRWRFGTNMAVPVRRPGLFQRCAKAGATGKDVNRLEIFGELRFENERDRGD